MTRHDTAVFYSSPRGAGYAQPPRSRRQPHGSTAVRVGGGTIAIDTPEYSAPASVARGGVSVERPPNRSVGIPAHSPGGVR